MSRGKFFEYLAKKLEKEEPVLKRVSGPSLRAMFERMIQKYEALQSFKQSEPKAMFLSTILMDKVGLMYRLHQYLTSPERQMTGVQEMKDSREAESETEEPGAGVSEKVNLEESAPSSPALPATTTSTASATTRNGAPVQDSSPPNHILEEALSQLSEYRRSIVQNLSACIADSTQLYKKQNDHQEKLSHRVDLVEEAVVAGRQSGAQATERQWNAMVEQSRQLTVLNRSIQSVSSQVHLQGEAIKNIQISIQEILRRLQ